MLSKTAALAILEAALKQMHVCILLHNDVSHLSHSPACFFCWPHQPELPAAFFLLLAACVLVVPAAGWCLAVLAHWSLAFSALRALIWGLHIETPYKKQQLKKAMPFAIYGGPASFACSACCCCSVLAARCAAAAAAVAAVASIATKTAAGAAATARTMLLLLLLLELPCLLPAPPPPSSLSSCCSLFILRLLLQFLLHLLLLPCLLLLLFLFSSCCFLAFGRFSLVPSEGPLISDQLRRGLLLFLRYFSTYSYPLLAHHHPSRLPATV
jgi:hypothetical protein